MDVRQYFKKLRQIEAAITEEFPIVISLDTPDGGKAGLASEVSRLNAAKMIAEGRAVLADETQRVAYQLAQLEAREAYESADFAKRVQIALVDHTALAQAKDKKSGK